MPLVRWVAALCAGPLLAGCSFLVSTDGLVGTGPSPSADGAPDGFVAGDADPLDAPPEGSGMPPIPGPLFVRYDFEGTTKDTSGSGHDGIMSGQTARLDEPGVTGTALSCATPGDQVVVGGDFRPGVSSFTLAVFFRIHVVDGAAARLIDTFFIKGGAFEDSTNKRGGFGFGYLDDEGVAAYVFDGDSSHPWIGISHVAKMRDGAFHHAAMVVDRGGSAASLSLYVDGVERNRANIPPGYGALDSNDVGKLCAESDATVTTLDGALDELVLYGRALAADEIATLAARR